MCTVVKMRERLLQKENRVNEMRRRELMQKFDLVVRELSELSVSSNELAERVEVITKGDKTF